MGQRFGVGLIPALIKRRGKQKRADGPEDVRRGRRVLREIVAVADVGLSGFDADYVQQFVARVGIATFEHLSDVVEFGNYIFNLTATQV